MSQRITTDGVASISECASMHMEVKEMIIDNHIHCTCFEAGLILLIFWKLFQQLVIIFCSALFPLFTNSKINTSVCNKHWRYLQCTQKDGIHWDLINFDYVPNEVNFIIFCAHQISEKSKVQFNFPNLKEEYTHEFQIRSRCCVGTPSLIKFLSSGEGCSGLEPADTRKFSHLTFVLISLSTSCK